MAASVSDYCSFLQNLIQVPVSVLSTSKEIAAFSEKYRFSPLQESFTPGVLGTILRGIPAQGILHLTDCFRIQFYFGRLDDCFVAIGPFCAEVIQEEQCAVLMRRLGVTDFPVQDFLVYRSQFGELSERRGRHAMRCLLNWFYPECSSFVITELDYSKTVYQPEFQDAPVLQSYGTLIGSRYEQELQMMRHVADGDAVSAISDYRVLSRSVAYLKRIGNTLENERIAAAIVRTTLRIAVMQAGLSPITVDHYAGASHKLVRKATTLDEIHMATEQLIEDYCRAMRELKATRYSGLVSSAIQYIRTHYMEECSASAIAEEFNVPQEQLSEKFKRQTGTTIRSYLSETRMEMAARLLTTTDKPIRDISAEVGILDANYFVKLFKKHHDMTPNQFRQMHTV